MCGSSCFIWRRKKPKLRSLLELNNLQKSNVAILLDKSLENLDEDANKLKKWMETQSHLPEIMDEQKIRNFLILNKCNIEKAKQKIDLYYSIRGKMPEVFERSNPKNSELKETFTYLYFVPLPKLTPDLYRVTFFKVRNSVLAQKYDPLLATIQFYNTAEIRLSEDFMYGDIIICDLQHVSFNMMTTMTPRVISKILAIYQVYSIGLKAIIFINSPPYVDKILSVLKAVIKPKIFERIHIYSDSGILREIFPKEMLPRDYGGVEKSLEELSENLKQKFAEYQNRFDKLDQLRVFEKLRSDDDLEDKSNSKYERNFIKTKLID